MGVWDDATDWYESRQEAAEDNRAAVVDIVKNPLRPGTNRRLLFDAAHKYDGEVAGAEDSYDVLEEGTRGREFFETVWDFEGTWRGGKDDNDIIGPSFDPSGIGNEDTETWGWRSDASDDDPTNPENSWLIRFLRDNPMAIVWVGIVAVALWLLKPLLTIVAGVTDG